MGFEIPSILKSSTYKEHVHLEKQTHPNNMGKHMKEEIQELGSSREEIKRALNTLAQAANIFNKRLKFQINEDIDRVVVKIIDITNNKVIKEIPSVEVQRLIARLKETIGLLIDEKI
jgi:flagellar protein FlaG